MPCGVFSLNSWRRQSGTVRRQRQSLDCLCSLLWHSNVSLTQAGWRDQLVDSGAMTRPQYCRSGSPAYVKSNSRWRVVFPGASDWERNILIGKMCSETRGPGKASFFVQDEVQLLQLTPHVQICGFEPPSPMEHAQDEIPHVFTAALLNGHDSRGKGMGRPCTRQQCVQSACAHCRACSESPRESESPLGTRALVSPRRMIRRRLCRTLARGNVIGERQGLFAIVYQM